MAGKKCECPDCRDKLQVPMASEQLSVIDLNPRMHDVNELIESISSLEFCKEALLSMVEKFNFTVDAYRRKNMELRRGEQAELKRQAESWANEADLIELREQARLLRSENQALKQELAIQTDNEQLDHVFKKVQAASGKVESRDTEIERLENINQAQSDQINGLSMQLAAQQLELQQLRLSQKESREKRDRLGEEISRQSRMIKELSEQVAVGRYPYSRSANAAS
ncbi:MAG: chromosome segregation ATPase [Kiritimatiellia bacterium]|jgi:chromosome segregation ATPase